MSKNTKKHQKFLTTAITASLVATAITPIAAAEDHKFTDVSKKYEPAVKYLLENGITKGMTATSYGTGLSIKRVDAAVMLAKALELNPENTAESGFSDVPKRAEPYVAALKKAGIIQGKTATTFASEQKVQRGEAALMLAAAFNINGKVEEFSFTDVPPHYKNSIEGLIAQGIIEGKTQTRYGTSDSLTRGEYALILYRISENMKVAEVDKEKLKAAIAKAEGLEESTYTSENWNKIQELIGNAKKVAANKNATQEEVDNALGNLNKVVDDTPKINPGDGGNSGGVVIPPVDNALLVAVAAVEKAESSRSLKDKNSAQILVNNLRDGATKEELQRRLDSIEIVDYTILNVAIAEAKKLQANDYTEPSWSTFVDVLKEAETVAKNQQASQDQIDTAIRDLHDTIRGLELKSEENIETVNKDALNTAINTAKALTSEKYSVETWKELQSALSEAKKVADNQEAKQSEVDTALRALQEAIQQLELVQDSTEIVNKEALDAAIANAKTLSKELYTETTWEDFGNKLSDAQSISKKVDASQLEVDAALKDLHEAIAGLELISVDGENKIDKKALQAAINTAKALSESTYSSETWSELQRSLDNAIEIETAERSTQIEIDGAVEKLHKALEGLVLKGSQTDKTDQLLVDEALAKVGDFELAEEPTEENVKAAVEEIVGSDITVEVTKDENGTFDVTLSKGEGTGNKNITVTQKDESVSEDQQAVNDALDKVGNLELTEEPTEENVKAAVEEIVGSDITVEVTKDENGTFDVTLSKGEGTGNKDITVTQREETVTDLEKTIAAVVKAEKSKLQEDVDLAKSLVDGLLATSDEEITAKEELEQRLASVQQDIDAFKEAEAAVNKAETDKTQGSIDTARGLVNKLPQDLQREIEAVEDFNDRLDTIQTEIDDSAEAAATTSVEQAEAAAALVSEKETILEKAIESNDAPKIREAEQALFEALNAEQQKYETAQKLVNELPNSSEVKAPLQNRLTDLANGIAERYVSNAERTVTRQSYNSAVEYIANLADSDSKNSFIDRLAIVKDALVKIEEARNAVTVAEREQTPEAVDAARTLVKSVQELQPFNSQDRIVNGLTQRLDDVEIQILRPDLEALLKEANDAKVQVSSDGLEILEQEKWVTQAVQNTFEAAITSAKGKFNNPDTTLEELKNEQSALQNAISAYNNAKQKGQATLRGQAEKAVSTAEETNSKSDYEKAAESVDLLRSDQATEADKEAESGLRDRLNKILAIILATEATEKAEGNPTLFNIETARGLVDALPAGEVKTDLTNRLDQLTTIGSGTREDLKAAIKQAEDGPIAKHNVDKSFYTDKSYENFQNAYDHAVVINEKDPVAELNEITFATQSLIDAMEKLIEAGAPETKPEAEQTESKKTVKLDLNPTIENLPDEQKTSGGVLGLDIGVVDLGLISASQVSALAGSNNVHTVNVKEGTTYSTDVTVAIHTILGGQSFDIGVYKKDANGNYARTKVLSGSSGGALGAASTAKFSVGPLEEGEYKFILDVSAGLAVVQVIPFKLVNQEIRDYTKPAEGVQVTGALLDDWNLGDKSAQVTSLKPSGKEEIRLTKETTTVQGDYGQLKISNDGKYTYTPANVPTNVGKVEKFEYTVTNVQNGEVSTAQLQIRIGGDTIDWGDSEFGQEATVVKANPERKTTKIEAQHKLKTENSPDARTGLAIWYNRTLESAEFQVEGKASVLSFEIYKNLSAARKADVEVVNTATKEIVWTTQLDVTNKAQRLTVDQLEKGSYKIRVKGVNSMGASTGRVTNIKVVTPDWGNYNVSVPQAVTGNLRTINGNKLSENATLKTTLSVKGYLTTEGKTSVTETYHKIVSTEKVIEGKYGTLTVQSNGDYSYTPKTSIRVAGQTEVFKYKLTHASGIESESGLTFTINPLTNATDGNDILTNTKENDTFSGLNGSDTVVYTVLEENAVGGNSADTWTDFHLGTVATDSNADRVDLRLLFDGQRITSLSSHVEVESVENTIVIKVDRDGPGSKYRFTDLLTLKVDNMPEDGKVDLQKLIDNGQLLVK